MAEDNRFFPHRAPIDSYGNGGFRFGGMSHQGSILILGDGMHAWTATRFADVTVADFAMVLEAQKRPYSFILGTGTAAPAPSRPLIAAFDKAGIGLQIMTTGAAVRTYNILLGENRDIWAGLIAVDTVR
ncbi:hypothetical protein G5V57_28240 [Nordella sp. HKS 07]|uniref:Mth938-like domain-containing protein n=1 Tax=Nordella sp. HKS 07 TaxID=2712222 RepID=UPI0013E1A711|nr:MTH938/NDUFAF3 family protein [Nordella sp. HKS 07]QIG51265.1 hypothetical protein G5V57_28240 [Nordella sp. HKS 07]